MLLKGLPWWYFLFSNSTRKQQKQQLASFTQYTVLCAKTLIMACAYAGFFPVFFYFGRVVVFFAENCLDMKGYNWAFSPIHCTVPHYVKCHQWIVNKYQHMNRQDKAMILRLKSLLVAYFFVQYHSDRFCSFLVLSIFTKVIFCSRKSVLFTFKHGCFTN